MKKLVFLLLLLAVYCTKDSNVTGGGDDTDTGIVIFMEDGKTPAKGATVKFIPKNYTQKIELNKKSGTSEIFEVTTEDDGTFAVPTMPDSVYNVIIEKDTLKAMQEDVSITSEENDITSDTLEQAGSVSAYVSLQSIDMINIQSVYVQILGNDVEYRNIDKNGKFSFNDLAAGSYRLRFEPDLPDYTTTFREITVESGVDSLLSDTIEIIYNGIDVVNNVWSEYDTAAGVLTLHWDPTEYSGILDYVIYRDKENASTYADEIHASVLDTLFRDTIYNTTVNSGAFSLSDTLSYSYKYRVAIRNNSTDIGRTYGITAVTAYPPMLVKASVNFSLVDSSVIPITPNDTVEIQAAIENPNRTLRTVYWSVDSLKEILDSTILDSTKKEATATLSHVWTELCTSTVYAVVRDGAGSLWKDSMIIHVVPGYPVANAGKDTVVTINDTIHLHGSAEDNGTIEKHEWKIDSSDWIETSGGDTSIIAPPIPQVSYICSLRVTDDDGFVDDGAVEIRVEASPPVAYAGNDTSVSISDTVFLRGTGEDNGDIRYAWKIGDEEWFGVAAGDTFFIATDQSGTVCCSLKVLDDDDQTAVDTVKITVTDQTPIVDADMHHNIGIGEEIQLQPKIKDDGRIVKYEWKFGDADWVETSSGDTTIIAPLQEGSYSCIINVTDDDGRSSSDEVVFNISRFTIGTVTTVVSGAQSVYATDIDGDGDMDVLSASYGDNAIRWYENNGSQQFTDRTITTTASGARSVFAIDIDGDGNIDVLSASENDDAICWYQNNGSQQFTRRTITTTADRARSVFATDMDGDGDMDVLSASISDDAIRWYENNGSQQFSSRDIFTSADGATSVYATDMDGDGDMDVLSASYNDDAIRWYENNGSQQFSSRNIFTSADGAQSVYATDMDGDGDMDVLSASYYDDAIRWYENNGSQQFTDRTITVTAFCARSVYATDMDGDGDMDVLSANDAPDYDGPSLDNISWYENNGSQQFTSSEIDGTATTPTSVYAIDMDGDGDMDVVCSAINRIRWYKNHQKNVK